MALKVQRFDRATEIREIELETQVDSEEALGVICKEAGFISQEHYGISPVPIFDNDPENLMAALYRGGAEAWLNQCAGAVFYHRDQKPERRPRPKTIGCRDMPISTDYIGLALIPQAAELYDKNKIGERIKRTLERLE